MYKELSALILSMDECPCETDLSSCTLDDYDEAIQLYQEFLNNAIIRNDKEEIKQLRRDIQRTKEEKRNFQKLLTENYMEGNMAIA